MFFTKKERNPEFSIKNNLKNKKRWLDSGKDVALAFMGGLLITTMIGMFSPGKPIIVGTPSIQTGVYWLDKMDTSYAVGDLISFKFKPTQDWIKERYSKHLVHTKFVVALAGDTVSSDENLNLTACKKDYLSGTLRWCRPLGSAKLVDSKHRTLIPWLKPGERYTLKENEIWVTGQHPRSLDSRYHGPVAYNDTLGTASLIFEYGEKISMEVPLEEQIFKEVQK